MTAPADLLELAERCEREEPSRELDAAIKAALLGGGGMPKPYGSSLDAAVTLLPARSWYPVALGYDGEDYHFALTLGIGGDDFVVGVANTEPMARCAAALRARASQP